MVPYRNTEVTRIFDAYGTYQLPSTLHYGGIDMKLNGPANFPPSLRPGPTGSRTNPAELPGTPPSPVAGQGGHAAPPRPGQDLQHSLGQGLQGESSLGRYRAPEGRTRPPRPSQEAPRPGAASVPAGLRPGPTGASSNPAELPGNMPTPPAYPGNHRREGVDQHFGLQPPPDYSRNTPSNHSTINLSGGPSSFGEMGITSHGGLGASSGNRPPPYAPPFSSGVPFGPDSYNHGPARPSPRSPE
jgi:hypothetical protein